MRPHGDTLGVSRECPLKELDEEPDTQKEPRREEYGRDKDDEHERANLRVREDKQIGSHDCGNRTAGSNRRDGRRGVGKQMHKGCCNASGDVEQEIPRMTEAVLDVVAEDPQEQHVTQNV